MRLARLVADHQVELGPFGATDPVALHGLDPFGPFELVEIVEQLLGVVSDLEEPLLEVALLDEVAGPLAGSVGQHLLVGQHRLASGAPVHGRLLAIGEARLVEAQEDPLVEVDVERIVTLDLAAPVVDRTDAGDRAAQLLDAFVGELPRVHTGLDRGVLGRQAEAVEAHGRQHGVAVHRAIADDQVAEGVVAHVSHVGPAARVRIHAQRVVVRAGVVVVDLVRAVVAPVRLPFGLDGLWVIGVAGARLGHAAHRTDCPLSPRNAFPFTVVPRQYGPRHVRVCALISSSDSPLVTLTRSLGAIAQLVERLHGMEEVRGPIPLSSTSKLVEVTSLNSFFIGPLVDTGSTSGLGVDRLRGR